MILNILEQIINTKKEEIKTIDIDPSTILASTHSSSLKTALQKEGLTLIAEVKQASPSKGMIYNSFDPIKLATSFEKNGAGAISVLTDEQYFKGSKNDLKSVREHVQLPILRKDFIIDPIQVYETASIGANAILLILDILSVETSNQIINTAKQLNLDVLIEVHHLDTLTKLKSLQDVDIVGINNRNLDTFEVNINHAIEYSQQIRQLFPKACIVAESGYSSTDHLNLLKHNKIDGVLIGEGLSKNQNLLEWFNYEN